MAGKKIGIVLALDGEKEFAQGVTNAKKESGALKAELKKLSAEFEGNANSMEFLTRKQEILTKSQDNYQKKLLAAQNGLRKAEDTFKAQAVRVSELEKELGDARQELEKLEQSGEDGVKAYKKQEKAVIDLEKALEKQKLAQQKEEGAISDWNKKIFEAESDIKKLNRSIKENESLLNEAENATDKCAKSIDKYGEAVQEAQKTESTWTGAMKEGLMQAVSTKGLDIATDLVKTGANAIKDTMIDASGASAQLAASTGLSEKAAKRYQSVMQKIKGDNFGESYKDISSAMSEVIQIMGELDDGAMTEVTESAIALRDTFEMDVNESVRAADVMIKTMRVDATTAFDLIAKGAQNGLNRSGELVDNIIEYGQIWGQAGFSAEEMFAILENGLDAGAYNLDKVNDYVKEFGNSLADGRIEENLSYFSEESQGLFKKWKTGGASTSDVFYSIIDDLSQMTNKQQALTIASEVWSALGEDNAMQVLTALDDVNDGYKNVKGTMESLKNVQYSDLESAASGLGNALQENVVAPIVDTALPAITSLFEEAIEVIEGLGEKVTPQKTMLSGFVDEIKASNEEVEKTVQNAKDTLSGAETNAAELDAYKQTLLDLNSETEKTELQKYQLKTIVSELSASIPQLAAAFDQETGSINLTNEEITKLIDNQKALVLQQASAEAQKESMKALYQANMNAEKSAEAVGQAYENLQKIQENDTGEKFADGWFGYVKASKEAEKELERAKETQEEANKAQEEAQTQYDLTAKSVENATKLTAEMTGTILESGDAAGAAANEAQGGAEAQAAALESVQKKYEEFRSQLENDIQNKISLFDAFDGGEDMTVEEMLANLQKTREELETWKANMETLAKEVGTSITPEFYNAIAEMGPEAANAVQHMVVTLDQSNGRELLEQMAEEWGASMDFSESMSESLTNAKETIETGIAEVTNADTENTDKSGFEQMGETIVNAIVSGVNAQRQEISDAISGAINPDDVEGGSGFENIGSALIEAMKSGIAAEKENTSAATEEVAKSAAQMALENARQFQNAGQNAASFFASGISSRKAEVSGQAQQMVMQAISAARSGTGAARSAGMNISAGVAAGIRAGQSGVISAASNMVEQAIVAAKARADIRSPSRVFRNQVGQQISVGTAFGINDKASMAGKAASRMSAKVYTNATAWLAKYKRSQKISLEDEKWYWQQVIKHTKSGTTAYNNALKKIQNIDIAELKATGLSSSVATKITKNFGVSRTTGSGKKKKKKDTDTYYSEVYSAAEKYLSNQQVLNDWSLKQELAYWNAVKGNLKSGTQAWYDATKQINSVQAEIAQAQKDAVEERATVQDKILSQYKVYYKVSAKAEMEYWNLARKQFKAGTDERIEADQNYLEAQREWYDQRKELDEDYAENSKEINDRLKDEIEDLQDAYKDAVQSRKDDILSQMDLFEAWDSEGYDADTLLYNLKTQVSGLALWEQQLEELGKKNVSSALMDELKAMGPDAAASIYSLNHMTAEQLEEYQKLWEQKNALAQSQAVKDNESLREETNQQITQSRLDAQAELNALNADYRAALAELNAGLSADLKNLVSKAGSIGEEAVSSMIAGIGKAANSVEVYNSTTKVVDTVSYQLSALAPEGKIIGADTLDGLLEGMTDQAKINIASRSVIQSIKRAMEEEAEIHSPARLFRRETGPQIPAGVAAGVEDGTEKAVQSAEDLVQKMREATNRELEKEYDIETKMNFLNPWGIEKLNRALESRISQQQVIRIENTEMDQVMERLEEKIEILGNQIGQMKVVLDDGALVGGIKTKIGQELAIDTKRKVGGWL